MDHGASDPPPSPPDARTLCVWTWGDMDGCGRRGKDAGGRKEEKGWIWTDEEEDRTNHKANIGGGGVLASPGKEECTDAEKLTNRQTSKGGRR